MDALSRMLVAFVLNALWQVALVAAAATLAGLLLRRGPARYRHSLWVVSLAAALALPITSLRQPDRQSSATYGVSTELVAVPDLGTPLPTGEAAAAEFLHRAWAKLSLASSHATVSLSLRLERGALAFYLLFVGFMLTRFARALVRTRRIRRHALVVDPFPQPLSDALEHCRRSFSKGPAKFARAPSILSSTRIAGPVTVGVRRPAIILPAALLESVVREDLMAAVSHEMAHIMRRDYLWNLVYELLYLPVSFHPLALLILRRIGDTRELACDELAAQVVSPATYARSLVRLAHDLSRRADAALTPNCSLGVFDANILEERVMRLLKPRASGHLAKLSLLSSAVVIASFLFAGARFSLGVSEPVVNRMEPGTRLRLGAVRPVARAAANGPRSGVPAGVRGGVPGGAIAGVSGGVPERAAAAKGAQNDSLDKTGSLSGIVVDSSGGRIPQAQVRLLSRTNNVQKSMSSDETGGFSFQDVPAGRYTLQVTSPGMGGTFRSFEFKAEGQPPFFPFVLHPGSVSESVAVTAKSPHTLGDKATKMGPHRIRIGGSVEEAKLIEGAQPGYPGSAKERGVQGIVVLEATIARDGTIEDLKVVSSPDEDLTQAAVGAVREWRYQPTLLNGEPVEVVTTVTVNFTLQD